MTAVRLPSLGRAHAARVITRRRLLGVRLQGAGLALCLLASRHLRLLHQERRLRRLLYLTQRLLARLHR